jgi:hypothetical protein
MPVGHATLVGLFVKLTGVGGLWGARLFSTVAYGLALVVLAAVVKGFSRGQALLIWGPWLTLPLLTMSRLARMESLFLLVAMLGLWALLRRRSGMALAAAALSALVHPNGAFVGLAVLACLAHDGLQRGWRAAWQDIAKDWVWLALSLVLIGLYTGYELNHLEYFIQDMGYQFSRKARVFHWAQPLNWGSLLVVGISALLAHRRGDWSRVVLTGWGGSLMLCRLVGQEIWYSPGYMVGLACVVAGWLWVPHEQSVVKSRTMTPPRPSLWLDVGVAGAVLSAVFYVSVFALGWHGVRIAWSDHLAGGGRENVVQAQAIVQALSNRFGAGRHVSVSCVPYEACLALWEPAAQAGFDIKLSNPLTLPPVGTQCLRIERRNAAGSLRTERGLDHGPIVSYTIAPCGHDWPES